MTRAAGWTLAPLAAGLAVVLVPAAVFLPMSSAASRPHSSAESPPGARVAQVKIPDGRDARRPLDVREVHSTAEPGRLVFYVMTWSRWRTRQIRDRAYVLTHLDTLPTPGFDYYVLLRSDGRRVRGNLYRVRVPGRDRRVALVTTWRNDSRSVSFRLPRSQVELTGPARPWGWQVQTLVTSAGCRRVCFDSAPDAGPAQETAPAASRAATEP